MEKEAPRKQPVEEVQRQYEAKLREAKRQRAMVEAELESVSERWRTERRRLNAEIDRLEAALTEATESRKKSLGTRVDPGIDPLDAAKIQASADEKVRKASKAWEMEREKLLKEVSRLQRAVGDLIEQSNNPLRTSMPLREEFDVKLKDVTRAKERIESDFMREKAEWNEEKLHMTSELIKLKHLSAQIKAPKGKLAMEERAKELEARIGSMQKEMDRERAEWRIQVQRLEKSLSDTSQSVNTEVVEQLRRQYDSRIQEMILQKTQLTDELKNASALLETERGRFATAAGTGTGKDNNDAIVAEVARVQKMITELGQKIDDPATDLSTVIRKNVERAELNAYLKGIQYSTGTGKGI